MVRITQTSGRFRRRWLPLRLHGTRSEEDAIAGRVLVDGVPLSQASGANATQKQSRGALRVRVAVLGLRRPEVLLGPGDAAIVRVGRREGGVVLARGDHAAAARGS